MAIQSLTQEEVYRALQTAPAGLTEEEAAARLRSFGLNEITETRGPSLLYTFTKHLTNLFALLLWTAAIIAFIGDAVKLGEVFLVLGLASTGVIFITGGFAFYQEYSAGKAFEELKKLLPFVITIIREGREREINAGEAVPGDIVLLKEGDRVPADIRLIESIEMKVDNSSLSGEANPVQRDASPHPDAELTESLNIAFAGTSVVRGQGRGVVFATGMSTEFGKIARLTSEIVSGMSPLEMETIRVTRTITIIAVCLGIIFFTTGVFIGRGFWENFIFALGIVVANVPEGLLPTVTLSLAMASQRMSKKKALVRKLTAVETLGSVTVICTDKTGTLTQNRMSAVNIYTNSVLKELQHIDANSDLSTMTLIKGSALCNDAYLRDGAIVGEQTEKALLEFAQNYIDVDNLRTKEPRIAEHPFDPFRKWMATLHEDGSGAIIYVKGAPEVLINMCTGIFHNGEVVAFDDVRKKKAVEALSDMTGRGLRVLAVAYRDCNPLPFKIKCPEWEKIEDLVLVGFLGLEDPPRPEVPGAIKDCNEAGIKIIMVTGDNPETARAVGREIGLFNNPDIVTGTELRGMNHKDIMNALLKDEIAFARVTPADKMTIVSALKDLVEVVAVTGDGVNDAPALKKADIGIAMGLSG